MSADFDDELECADSFTDGRVITEAICSLN